MNTSPDTASAFRVEVLNVIVEEVRKMQEENRGYIGVEFSSGERSDISISYASSRRCFSGQPVRYPHAFWKDLCYVMRMIGRISHNEKKPTLISNRDSVGFDSFSWVIYPLDLGSNWQSLLPAIFRRVDDALAIIDEPLNVGLSVPLSASSQCLQCKAPLILMDGSDRLVCSEGCLPY